jgi:hypothetical protein
MKTQQEMEKQPVVFVPWAIFLLLVPPWLLPVPWWLAVPFNLAVIGLGRVRISGRALIGWLPFVGPIYFLPSTDASKPERRRRVIRHQARHGVQIERDGLWNFYWGWLTSPAQRCEYEGEAYAETVLEWIEQGRMMWDNDTTILTRYSELLSEKYWLPKRFTTDYCREVISRYIDDSVHEIPT